MTETQRIRFESLISRIEGFQDMIPTAKATGRPTQPQTSAQPASAVLERTKLAQMLREFNSKL